MENRDATQRRYLITVLPNIQRSAYHSVACFPIVQEVLTLQSLQKGTKNKGTVKLNKTTKINHKPAKKKKEVRDKFFTVTLRFLFVHDI